MSRRSCWVGGCRCCVTRGDRRGCVEWCGGREHRYVPGRVQGVEGADGRCLVDPEGGRPVVDSYDQIGVVVASSSDSSFASNAVKDNQVEGAAATAGFATSLDGMESGGADQGAPVQPGVRRRPATRSRRCSGTWPRSTHPRRTRSRRSRRCSSATSTPASTSTIRTSRRTSTTPTASTASSGAPVPGTAARGRQRPRHSHGRHDRGGRERHRDRRRGAKRKHRRHQGRERRRLLLPGGRRLRVHVGGDPPHRRDEQQLLRRPVPVQLQERPGAAGDLEGGAARDHVRGAAGRHGRLGRRERERGHSHPTPGPDEPRQHHSGRPR